MAAETSSLSEIGFSPYALFPSHFVGSLDRTGDFAPVDFGDGFTAWLCRRGAPTLPALKDLPLVQLEFHATHVPWGLSEPEAM
jgi:hypothetical protein